MNGRNEHKMQNNNRFIQETTIKISEEYYGIG